MTIGPYSVIKYSLNIQVYIDSDINVNDNKCMLYTGLCSIYQVTMSPELRHKERNNVLSLRNNERWHLTWYIEHHPLYLLTASFLKIMLGTIISL